jgi:dihydrolipoamide dehydrogenase
MDDQGTGGLDMSMNREPEQDPVWDLVVVGAGPGGYVAAIRATQLGLRVLCVDARSAPGGTCLHEGCVPSKALLTSSWKRFSLLHDLEAHGLRLEGGVAVDLPAMVARKQSVITELAAGIQMLFRKYRVAYRCGRAVLQAPGCVLLHEDGGGMQEVRGRAILLATGSEPVPMAGLPVDGTVVYDSRHLLELARIPGRLVVVGGGAIGLELGSMCQWLGSAVTVLESQTAILATMDETVVRQAKRALERQGLAFLTSTRIQHVTRHEAGVRFAVTTGPAGTERIIEADAVLVAAGRRPRLDVCGPVDLARTPDGRVVVDACFRTSCPGVFALGDMIAGPMLAHRAMEEGVAFAGWLAQGQSPDVACRVTRTIPQVVYTHPEVMAVGMTGTEALRQGMTVRSGACSLVANGRARAAGESDGVVKVVMDGVTQRILGVHAVGEPVSELAAVAVLCLERSMTAPELGQMVFPHPTVGEAIREAALMACDQSVHR